jgi:hypothetical protein
MICEYGCGQEGVYQLKNGKWCCNLSQNSCPEIIKKLSRAAEGRKHSVDTLRKMGDSHRGIKRPDHSALMKQKMLGENNPNFGKTGNKSPRFGKPGYWKGKKRPDLSGENNPWFEIKRPDIAEIMKQRIGDKHPLFGKTGELSPGWKGGISKDPYPIEFKRIRGYIREKFNYECVLCGITEDKIGRKHSCHHVDYDKSNISEENLTLLCQGDNARVNTDRGFWETQFKILNGVFDPKFLGL